MNSDYADNWDALPAPVQEALAPIVQRFDEAADLLFDRRLNLSFEVAVTALSVPGVVALTDALRRLREMLETRVTVIDVAAGALLFDQTYPLTAYDLPFYMPSLYLSQVAQSMDEENVRVWKESTAAEIVAILRFFLNYIRPDIMTARVVATALQDMIRLYPSLH